MQLHGGGGGGGFGDRRDRIECDQNVIRMFFAKADGRWRGLSFSSQFQ
jgi:hypothetical protein